MERRLHFPYVVCVYKQDNLDLGGLKGLFFADWRKLIFAFNSSNMDPCQFGLGHFWGWGNLSVSQFSGGMILAFIVGARLVYVWICSWRLDGWNPQAFGGNSGGFRWMQTLKSSEKVYPGISLVDAVFFLSSDSPLASLHTAEGMGWGGGKYLSPFIQGDSNHESLKILVGSI